MTEGNGAEATPPPLPERSYGDVLGGRIRFRLAGQDVVMPVLTRRQNREWLETLNVAFAPLIDVGEDETLEEVVQKLVAVDDRLLDFVYSYDVAHVLPDRASIEDDIFPHEIIRAVIEVRVAANPTLGYALAAVAEDAAEQRQISQAMLELKRLSSSPTTTGSRKSTAGRSKKRTN